jgi:hypothetical protein
MTVATTKKFYAAFSKPFGNFMATRVQFGFQGAPVYVQSMVSEASRNFPGCQDFRLFIDDTAVEADSMEELYVKIDAFLKSCTAYNLKLQKDKLQNGVRALKYWGVVVCEHGKYSDPSRIQALPDVRRPIGARGQTDTWILNLGSVWDDKHRNDM